MRPHHGGKRGAGLGQRTAATGLGGSGSGRAWWMPMPRERTASSQFASCVAYFSQLDSSISPYGSTILTPGGGGGAWHGRRVSLRSQDPNDVTAVRVRVGGIPLSGSGLCDAVIMTPIVATTKRQQKGKQNSCSKSTSQNRRRQAGAAQATHAPGVTQGLLTSSLELGAEHRE